MNVEVILEVAPTKILTSARRPAAGVRGDDDVGKVVAIHLAGRDEQAAGKRALEGGELANDRRQAEGADVGAVPDLDDRSLSLARRGDDVGEPVAVHIARGNADTAGEPGA